LTSLSAAIFRPEPLDSTNLLLLTLVGLLVLTGILFQVGVLGRILGFVFGLLGGAVRRGFQLWRRLLSWASWPIYAGLVIGLLAIGLRQEEEMPALAILCSLALLFIGVVACLAYVFLDLERYDVSRGYKALRDPRKGQELAINLVRYGPRVGIPLLIAATLAVIGGFALLNQGLYDTVGESWYSLRAGQAITPGEGGAGADAPEPAYGDFLVYTLINFFRIVDLLNIGDTYHLKISYVHQTRWPASTLIIVFRAFFTLVLLQQIFASVRQMKLLWQTIEDFWSPHQSIQEQARADLPQHGARAVAPLLASVRSVPFLTAEQRSQVPAIIADIGAAAIPTLVRHLRDPNENVRAVAVAALGRVDAIRALPRLAWLSNDPSEWVRQSLVETLGLLGSAATHLARQRRRFRRLAPPRRHWLGWVVRLKGWARRDRKLTPVELAVETLRSTLADPSAAVRRQAAASLGDVGPAAAAAAPELIGLLHDADETVRCQAAESLGKLGGDDPATVTALEGLLQDASSAVQTAAVRALGALQKDAAPAVPAIIPLLQDADAAVRKTAAEAIGQIGTLPQEAASDLVEGLSNRDNVVRAQTAEALGHIGETAADAVPALIKALADANDRVRAKAAEALGKIGPPAAGAIPSLVQALHDPDNLVRANAAASLGEMGPAAAPAVPTLIECLGHINPQVRGNAAHALGRLGPAAAQAVPALATAAGAEDGEVRVPAVFALGEIGSLTESARRVLLAALADADPRVRAASVEAVGKREELGEEGVRALRGALNDTNDEVKVQVTRALPQRAGATPEVIAGLCRFLDDDNDAVQMAAAVALGKLNSGATAAGVALLRVLQTAEAAVREQAMRAIALIQPPEALQAFAVGLKDASVEVRKLASAGLMKVKEVRPEVVAGLVEALRDPEIQVRSNAACALARLDPVPPQAIPLLVECTADPDDGLRMNAVLALKAASPESINAVVSPLLDDPNLRIRLIAAGLLLGENPTHPKAGGVVLEALADSTALLRKRAMELVEGLGPRAAHFLEAYQTRLAVEGEPEIKVWLTQLVERLTPGDASETPAGSPALVAAGTETTGRAAPPAAV
jgi:HEAT repeat protein